MTPIGPVKPQKLLTLCYEINWIQEDSLFAPYWVPYWCPK